MSQPIRTSTSVKADSAPPPSSPGLPSAPDYLFSARLDPGPQPLDDIVPEYPPGSEERPGSVVLRILVNETGGVDNAAVVRATPPGIFDASAIEAFSKARFSPAKLLGVAVKSQLTIEVKFTPLDRGAKVSGRSY